MKLWSTVIVGGLLGVVLLILLVGTYILTLDGCSAGTYSCSLSNVCVPQRAVCNGHADCPDGEDESAVTCGDLHGSQYIINLMNRVNFNVSLHICDHKGLPPSGCYCRHDDWVYCKQLNLTEVPRHIIGNVSRLILSNNSITKVSRSDFLSYDLKLLHMEGNGIEYLPNDLLRDQIHLDKILLMNNKIQKIDGQIFKGLTQLSMIWLQMNSINYIDRAAFQDLVSLRYLDLSDNELTLTDGAFPFVPYLVDLLLDRNQIIELRGNEWREVTSLNYLGLSGNGLRAVNQNSFNVLANITELDLSHNQLLTLPADVFINNGHLKKLFLGYNLMTSLSKDWFLPLQQISSLDLQDLEIENINTDLFDSLHQLDFIYFKRYYYCTFASNVKRCEPKTDGLSTFENLLGKPSLRMILWVTASCTCIGNAYVFFGRLSARDENQSLSWIIKNLAVADFLMGLYLYMIGWKDIEYRSVYHKLSHVWMGSWLCTCAGALAMLSSQVSILILVFMSVERFLVIAMPFRGLRALSYVASHWWLSFIWLIGIAIAVGPVIAYRNNPARFYGSNAMCFPLHLDDPYLAGWQFSAFVFLAINCTGLVVVSVMYTGMLTSIWRTRRATRVVGSARVSVTVVDCELALRFFFIVITNAACWLPIILLKILAFYRLYISSAAYAWIAVFVIPVNSTFNPLLYTLTTPKYRDIIRNIFLQKRMAKKKNPLKCFVENSCSSRQQGLSSSCDAATSFDDFCQESKRSQVAENDVAVEHERDTSSAGCADPISYHQSNLASSAVTT